MMTDPEKAEALDELAKQAEDLLYGPGDAPGCAVAASRQPVPRLPALPPEPGEAQSGVPGPRNEPVVLKVPAGPVDGSNNEELSRGMALILTQEGEVNSLSV